MPPKSVTHNISNHPNPLNKVLEKFRSMHNFNERKMKNFSDDMVKTQIKVKFFYILKQNINHLMALPVDVAVKYNLSSEEIIQFKLELTNILNAIKIKFHRFLDNDKKFTQLLSETDKLIAESISKIDSVSENTEITETAINSKSQLILTTESKDPTKFKTDEVSEEFYFRAMCNSASESSSTTAIAERDDTKSFSDLELLNILKGEFKTYRSR